jgi:hypothetical protein
VDREPGSTSGSLEGVGDLFTALRRQGLIADELVLQLATFLRSLDLFLELSVWAPRALTTNQIRHGGKQGTDKFRALAHSFQCLAGIDFTAAEPPAQRLTISLMSRSFISCTARPSRHVRFAPVAPKFVQRIGLTRSA